MKSLILLALGLGVVINCPPAAASEVHPELRSIFGQNHFYDQISESTTKALVFVFLDESCPIVQQYAAKLVGLSHEYAGHGVIFIGVYSDPKANIRSVANHAMLHQIPFHTFVDVRQALAKTYQVKRKATALLVNSHRRDSRGRLATIYRGAIDDQFAAGAKRPEASRFYLKDALDDFLAGRPAKLTETPVAGCKLSFHSDNLTAVTFYKDVLPILQSRCQACHRVGESAPMPLISYDDTAAYADMIAEVVTDRRMPPWPAESTLPLLDDHRLTTEQIDVLVAWASQGAPKGHEKNAPPPVRWPDAKAWKIGKPDLVLKTKPYRVPRTGTVQYVYRVIPTFFDEDRFVQASEVRTSRPGVVHHIQVLEGKPDSSITEVSGPVELGPTQQIALHGFSLEDSKLVAGYTPGNNDSAIIYPAQKGLRIKKGAVLYVETHYTTNGTETTEDTEIGFVFRRSPPAVELHTQWFYRHRGHFIIPPHAAHFELVKDDIFVKNHDVHILSMRMHLHARGKDFLIEKVTSPNGTDAREPLIWVPCWDFNWQRSYHFATPVELLCGQSLRATAHWDNTSLNPHNPDSNQRVTWGQQTSDEMMALMITYEVLEHEDSSHDSQN